MTDEQAVVVEPGQPVRLGEYEVMTRLLDPSGFLRYRPIGDDSWDRVALFSRDGAPLPAGWRPAGRLFEVSGRWSDSPAVILVRLATRP